MDPFVTSLAVSIAGNLAPQVISASGRKLKKLLTGSEKEQAVKRCLEAALTAMLSSVTWEDEEEGKHVDTLFREFFEKDDVAPALAELIKGNRLNREELCTIFENVGYDPQSAFPFLQKGIRGTDLIHSRPAVAWHGTAYADCGGGFFVPSPTLPAGEEGAISPHLRGDEGGIKNDTLPRRLSQTVKLFYLRPLFPIKSIFN